MKKAVKVLSTAALAATLVAPVAVTPVSAASTYSVSAVKSVSAGATVFGDVTRISVKIPAGTLTSASKMRLRLPADSYAGIKGVSVASGVSTIIEAGGTHQIESIKVTAGATASGNVDVDVVHGAGPSTDTVSVPVSANDSVAAVATKIATEINNDGTLGPLYTATAVGDVVYLTADAAAANDANLAISLNNANGTGVTLGTSTNFQAGSATESLVPTSADGVNGVNQVGSIKVTPVGGITGNTAQEWEIEVDPTGGTASAQGLFYIDLVDLKVPSGINGALNATIESPDGLLSNGSITVANVGSGSVATSIDDVNAIQNSKNQSISTIRIKEDRPGSLKGTYTLKLPKGFTWSNSSYSAQATKVWGDSSAPANISVQTTDDPRKLKVVFTGSASTALTATDAAYYAINGLSIDVDDAIAEKGDVNVTVDGDSSYSNSTLLVGRYGDYNTNATAAEAPVALAGQDGQDIANITIAEEVPGSLLDGRTIKLRLTGNAKWTPTDLPKLDDALSDKQGVNVKDIKLSESDRSVVTMTVDASSRSNKKPAKLVFTKGQIDTAANASEQDVKVIIEGTAGAKGEVTVAKLKPAVTLTTEGDVPKAVIGAQEQAVADFVITEAQKGVIDDGGKKLILHFPSGVKPTLPAKVEVTEGDLVLDTTNISKDGQDIFIPVKYDSSKPSKIKVSGVKVNVDRTVSEGDLKVEVRGDAVVTTNDKLYASLAGYTNYIPFENNNVAASAVVAKVVTPAAKDTTAQNIVFKLNSKTYTVDGKEFEMDTAPLVGWDRAYLPVRFAANALNVKDDNIIWDDKTSTFTVFKGDRVITGKVGDKFLTVNGVKVPMDVPVWRDKAKTNNRVMVPIRYLSNALGADIQWNQETSEITIGVK